MKTWTIEMQRVTGEHTGVDISILDAGSTERLGNKLQCLGKRGSVLQPRNDSHAEPSAASNSA